MDSPSLVVKPALPSAAAHVLVHVIDGLVIEESNDPLEIETASQASHSPELTRHPRSRIFRRRRGSGSGSRGRSRLRTYLRGSTRRRTSSRSGATTLCEGCGVPESLRSLLPPERRFCSEACRRRYWIQPRIPDNDVTADSLIAHFCVPRFVAAATRSQIHVQMPPELISTSPSLWTLPDVVTFVRGLGYGECVQAFVDEEIDGRSFLLLQLDHMVSILKLKLGTALKINDFIDKLKSVLL
ncbi:polyhomeotic-like protein 3 [Oscarella lobularis]|uniref:polyhomeotic-like protein 3 n=1 Tax=Oscarella lobularis TaxID=121494 RepID=UPI00331448CB